MSIRNFLVIECLSPLLGDHDTRNVIGKLPVSIDTR